MPKVPKGTKKRKFDYSLDYASLDLRAQPELYCIGVGEQGVFHVQPYKDELLPLWRFSTPDKARQSARAIMEKYEEYKRADDFPGVDMARKYLQKMGFTRSRRYANRKGGRKRDKEGRPIERLGEQEQDEKKAESARIFREALEQVKADRAYIEMAERHRASCESSSSS